MENKNKNEILSMALLGYRQVITALSEKVGWIEKELLAPAGRAPRKRPVTKHASVAEAPKPKRKMSAAHRAAVSKAQKARWAKIRRTAA